MTKKNSIIAIVSVALASAAGYFIYRSFKSKKETNKLLEEETRKQEVESATEPQNNTISEQEKKEKGLKVAKAIGDDIKSKIWRGLGLGEKVETKSVKENELIKNLGKSSVLYSKVGTRLRENPNTTSKIVATIQKAKVKLTKLPFVGSTMFGVGGTPATPVTEGKNIWFYVQQEGTDNKGWVRSDVVTF